MDNGALAFIIIIEAVIIVWLASKLKQYEKFERLLSAGEKGQAETGSRPASAAGSDTPATDTQGQSSPVNAASRAVASAVSAGESEDEDLLDMPGVDPEANIEEAKRVQLVMARCRYAEFYLEQLDDDYERSQFQRIVNSCRNTALDIKDPFFRASALQPLILLLDRAEWTSERDQLLAAVDDELVKQRITEELSEEITA